MANKKHIPMTLEMGKVPPQAIELEQCVLGAIMIEKEAISDVADILCSESFYKDENIKIYQSILDLYQNDKAIDIFTVQEQLNKNGCLDEVGGFMYLASLTEKIASAVHIEHHAKIVHEKFIQRELIRVSSEIQQKAFDDSSDIEDLLSFSENEILSIGDSKIMSEAERADIIMEQEINVIAKLTTKEIDFTGIPSGYSNLDKLTGGWQDPNLVIIAARPGMGKTAFALHFAKNAAFMKYPTAFFSLEMSSRELVKRLISYDTDINSMAINKGDIGNNELAMIDGTLMKYRGKPLYIDDKPAISIFELRARVRRYKKRFGIKFMIVDYIQLMSGDRSGNREQEVSSISRGLKLCAKENNIPIIALSQLNRISEMSGSKRPQLSNLRESGAIEQDADMVAFIHRPEKYGLEEMFDEYSQPISTKGLKIFILEKYRNGPTGDVLFQGNDSFTQLTDE